MDGQEILVRKNGRDEALGGHRDYQPGDLAHGTGLKMSRFRLPEEFTDRQILAPHPIVSLLCQGRTQSRLRYGLQDISTECRASDLMFSGGSREIDQAQWRTRNALMVSIELDPARLSMIEAGDTRFTERPLNGTPCFNDPDLVAMMRALWREVSSGGAQGRLYIDSLCLGLAAHVHRRFGRLETLRGEDRREARSQLSGVQLRRVDAYIRHHLGEPLGLADLAREAGLSRYHFTRLFTQTVGQSPYQYVLHKRLERAFMLLREKNVSMAEVALAAGFSSQSHFSGVCRRVLGATPSELRARH